MAIELDCLPGPPRGGQTSTSCSPQAPGSRSRYEPPVTLSRSVPRCRLEQARPFPREEPELETPMSLLMVSPWMHIVAGVCTVNSKEGPRRWPMMAPAVQRGAMTRTGWAWLVRRSCRQGGKASATAVATVTRITPSRLAGRSDSHGKNQVSRWSTRIQLSRAEPENALPPPPADRLRRVLEQRRNAVWERLGGVNEFTGESADAAYRRLARETIEAEREVFARLRDERRIDDEMLRTLLRHLDLEEAAAECPEQ
jgi:hypothetical protein